MYLKNLIKYVFAAPITLYVYNTSPIVLIRPARVLLASVTGQLWLSEE